MVRESLEGRRAGLLPLLSVFVSSWVIGCIPSLLGEIW